MKNKDNKQVMSLKDLEVISLKDLNDVEFLSMVFGTILSVCAFAFSGLTIFLYLIGKDKIYILLVFIISLLVFIIAILTFIPVMNRGLKELERRNKK